MPRKVIQRNPALGPKRQERQERREEIIARWNRRVANRNCEAELAKGENSTVATILNWAAWAPLEDLIEYINPEEIKHVLSRCFRIIQLKEMPYDEYLQTDEWKRLADYTKTKYGAACALDSSHPAEHAHHRTYERRGREWGNDLIPLCADCHAKFHGRKPR
jgi:hypothetical protein